MGFRKALWFFSNYGSRFNKEPAVIWFFPLKKIETHGCKSVLWSDWKNTTQKIKNYLNNRWGSIF
jgi:hypothetical protein